MFYIVQCVILTVSITIGTWTDSATHLWEKWRCGQWSNGVGGGNTVLFTCERNARGSTLNLVLTNKQIKELNVCEVAVYGQSMLIFIRIRYI